MVDEMHVEGLEIEILGFLISGEVMRRRRAFSSSYVEFWFLYILQHWPDQVEWPEAFFRTLKYCPSRVTVEKDVNNRLSKCENFKG